VTAENLWTQMDHFATADRQAGIFETGDDFAADFLFDSVWFQENKSAFHSFWG
jgi:hypothetical protein